MASPGSEKCTPRSDEDLERSEPQLQRRLLTPFLLSKKVPPIPKEDERKPYPYLKTNPLSQILFWWLNPLLRVGYKRTLDPNDFYYLEHSQDIETTYSNYEMHLARILEKDRAKAREKDPTLTDEDLKNREYPKNAVIKALFLTFKWKYLWSIFLKLLSDIVLVLNPLLSKALINFVDEKMYNPDMSVGRGVGYAIGVTFMLGTSGILINHFLYLSLTVGAHCKAVLTTAIMNKSFRASAKSKHEYPSGRVTSLMSTDLARIDLAIGFQPFAITVPVPIGVAIALLIVNIGVSALAGIAVFLVCIVVISASSKSLLKMRKGANQYTDARISYMREILQNMRIIKFYSWEDAYEKSVVTERNSEMSIILKMQSIRNFLLALSLSLPAIISMVAFLVLYGVSNDKNPGNIFSSISLFSVLAQQTMMLPMALATGADAKIGLERLRQYLQSGDIEKEYEDHEKPGDRDVVLPDNVAVELNNASFIWEKFDDADDNDGNSEKTKEVVVTSKSSLTDSSHIDKSTDSADGEYIKSVFEGFSDINLTIKKGEFVIITGPIGSGKSSLLVALAGFMKKTTGTLGVNGTMLLCGQPWVQNCTVRDNILFGLEYDKDRYDRVVEVCALGDDLKMFTAGDQTEIGERGITLSGGQKARINLARAVYANKDIILLDDVLSAVDARVGKLIVDDCLTSFLGDKTRILATHQLSLIEAADRVIYLNGDGTIHIGTVQELLESNEGFLKLMKFSKKSESEEEENVEAANEKDVSLQKAVSVVQEQDAHAGVLIGQEERAVNGIEWDIYKEYLHEGRGKLGIFAIPTIIMLLVLDVFTSIFVNVWLSFWISHKFKARSDGFYIGLYVMFVILSVIWITAEFVVMGYFSSTAARRLNLKAMKRVLHTPMHFLDVTPMGRILNRFTKDTDVLDNEIGEQARMFLHPAAYVIGVLILCIIYIPWFAIAIPPLAILFTFITNFYIASSREVKRIEAIQRSLVYNNFNEVLNGLQTLKAYNATSRFMEKNKRLLNRMNEAYLLVIANQRWISVNLDLVSCCFVFLISMLSVFRVFDINASSVGLVVTSVLQIGGLMSLIMRAYTTVENEMNSVERLCHYANKLEQEAPYIMNETKPRPTWPEHGAIEFKHASMRYREGLPLVLKDLTISVKGGEKIGICGRTGAGKSTIMNALYRLTELAEGSITIDDVEISQLGLYDLRSKLAIIPQDPVLFRGTIRKNLDPFGQNDDETLWDALRRSGLVEGSILNTIKSQSKDDPNFHKFHLDQTVEDEGANFSLGERQLIALARALVRNSKILILDEATSSVDYETDSKIQKTISTEFSHCTILCIAHRLKTILTYDRILVLEKGEVEEFDTPRELYSKNGVFRQMCERSEINSADFV
ncbi:ATP-binding cassette transporter YOR1 [Cyberlindnera jadinii NRRL Y-1542]|uniref:p-loop containing nucleoside triphosphate hydrolase protein n=1 Tax=Cyberlindnera jadinii (strain ATCC 18201 / CBS 1600 / BCRC 20928 / JCM 3617 / NBRC 0987 / NRRL Y-1542) TaxID=983966 RepID=A0A1E4S5W6_CYBJN|nr:P-loop containing nucleoside triphosphate hydrolase protein [Cyberlindnera jadinii NRRL Y-1542]ODV74894.1 P-loop containing nucleoside triphosphate hydrolase protein [Cyberlindnera jadinii NRRL Y-1542]